MSSPSLRLSNALARAGVMDPIQTLSLSYEDLNKLPRFGPGIIRELSIHLLMGYRRPPWLVRAARDFEFKEAHLEDAPELEGWKSITTPINGRDQHILVAVMADLRRSGAPFRLMSTEEGIEVMRPAGVVRDTDFDGEAE